jgi:hypothetical protein
MCMDVCTCTCVRCMHIVHTCVRCMQQINTHTHTHTHTLTHKNTHTHTHSHTHTRTHAHTHTNLLLQQVLQLSEVSTRVLTEEEEEEEEDLFVFNDIIGGPRAPAVKPGRITRVRAHHSIYAFTHIFHFAHTDGASCGLAKTSAPPVLHLHRLFTCTNHMHEHEHKITQVKSPV